VKGIVITDVIISSVRREDGSIGKPHIGKNGIGNKISSQIPTRKAIIFHLCLSLEPINTFYYHICKLTFSWNNLFAYLTHFIHVKHIQNSTRILNPEEGDAIIIGSDDIHKKDLNLPQKMLLSLL
jgi:hypothetical protein